MLYTRHTFVLLFFVTGLFLLSPQLLFSQASQFFSKRGNNFSGISCGGILYAPIQNKYHQAFGAGAAWVRKAIDLRQPFSINFVLDYTDIIGTDGGAFVLQTDTNAVGEAFNGFGYRKIDKSIAITFDAVKNDYDNDPDFDHISIQANGDLAHSSPNNLAGPFSLESFYKIQPDSDFKSFHHLITISWEPLRTELSAAIDGIPVIAVKKDIINTIFNGNPIVYQGFTASNTQTTVLSPEKEVTLGYMYFFFGDVFPKYYTKPALDTCFIQPVSFFDTSVYASDYSLLNLALFKWHWDFGDGTFSTDRNPPPHYFPEGRIYELKFAVTNQAGCTTDTLTQIIKLGSIPVPDFNVEALCTNSATLFRDSTQIETGTPVAWQWDFGNGNTSKDKNPVITFTTPGIKTITLTVNSEFGCRADTTKIIVISDKPEADFNYLKDCEGVVSFSPLITNNVPIKEWKWNFGDGFNSNESNTAHHFFKNDTYSNSLLAISETGCISDTIKKNILINKVYPFAGNDTIVATGQPLQLQASGGTIYQWYPSTGINNSSINNPVAVLSQDQVYALLVKNEDGCEGRDTITIKVYRGPELYVPSAFTPDNNGLNDLFRITAPGLKQLEFIQVYDRWGKLVFQTNDINKGWNGKVNGVEQGTGTYVWVVKAIDYSNAVLFKKGTVTLIR